MKTCTCGAKFTTFPDIHSVWCDFSAPSTEYLVGYLEDTWIRSIENLGTEDIFVSYEEPTEDCRHINIAPGAISDINTPLRGNEKLYIFGKEEVHCRIKADRREEIMHLNRS